MNETHKQSGSSDIGSQDIEGSASGLSSIGLRIWAPLRKHTEVSVPIFTLIVLGIIWEVVTRVFDIPHFILAPPSSIYQATVENYERIILHTQITAYETLAGFALAVIVSIPLAIMIVYSSILRHAIYPLLLLTNAVPKVAIAPLLLLALGYGQLTKVVVAFLVCFFPIVINTATGLADVPEERILLGRSSSASKVDIFRKIRFPSALPMMFVGLKLGIILAVIGAVVGEFVGASEGLGFLILISTANARTGLAYAALVTLGLMSIVLFYAITGIERIVVPWAKSDE